jgi:hypothetical protein
MEMQSRWLDILVPSIASSQSFSLVAQQVVIFSFNNSIRESVAIIQITRFIETAQTLSVLMD